MTDGIFEILEKAEELDSFEDKVSYLRSKQSKPLQIILQYTFDPNIEWLISSDFPKFNKNDSPVGLETALLAETRRLYLFVKGGHDKLSEQKRNTLLIQLLEMLHPKDIEILKSSIHKTLPFSTITYDLVKTAFPDILPDTNVKKQRKKNKQKNQKRKKEPNKLNHE